MKVKSIENMTEKEKAEAYEKIYQEHICISCNQFFEIHLDKCDLCDVGCCDVCLCEITVNASSDSSKMLSEEYYVCSKCCSQFVAVVKPLLKREPRRKKK